MKSFFRVFIFILAFQVEVRVRASGELLEQPALCLKTQDICSLQINNDAFHFEKKDLRFHATPHSTLSRLSLSSWKLIRGNLWVEKGRGLEVETLYGSIQGTGGSYWVLDQGDKVILRNITADLSMNLRDGSRISIPEGFEVWVSGINTDGKSSYGMIRPIDMKEHLPLWSSLFRGSKEDFIAQSRSLKERWGDLAVKGSDLYQKVVDRRIASADEKKRQDDEIKAQKAAERQRVRELFYKRTFER